MEVKGDKPKWNGDHLIELKIYMLPPFVLSAEIVLENNVSRDMVIL
jgi:hypothetical protein